MKIRVLSTVLACGAVSSLVAMAGCSLPKFFSSDDSTYSSSGTVLLSRAMPGASSSQFESNKMTPLIGYVPPTGSFLPALNESWLEVDQNARLVRLYRGSTLVREAALEGSALLAPGVYQVQRKESNPRWYASDTYFTNRNLPIPGASAAGRYLRGAMGEHAIFATPSFAIHSGAVWTPEVGGLSVNDTDLRLAFEALPLGAAIKVR